MSYTALPLELPLNTNPPALLEICWVSHLFNSCIEVGKANFPESSIKQCLNANIICRILHQTYFGYYLCMASDMHAVLSERLMTLMLVEHLSRASCESSIVPLWCHLLWCSGSYNTKKKKKQKKNGNETFQMIYEVHAKMICHSACDARLSYKI